MNDEIANVRNLFFLSLLTILKLKLFDISLKSKNKEHPIYVRCDLLEYFRHFIFFVFCQTVSINKLFAPKSFSFTNIEKIARM